MEGKTITFKTFDLEFKEFNRLIKFMELSTRKIELHNFAKREIIILLPKYSESFFKHNFQSLTYWRHKNLSINDIALEFTCPYDKCLVYCINALSYPELELYFETEIKHSSSQTE